MSKKQKKAARPDWKFFWKNVDGLGRLNRMAAGAGLIYLAGKMKDGSESSAGPNATLLTAFGVYLLVVGFLRWCSLRALFKKPTRKAFKRHYPEAA